MEADGVLLELRSVSKTYDSVQSGEHLPILSGVSFQIGQGESVAVVGPSGSGKSTLLNIMGTLDHPTSGQVLLQGKDLSQSTEEELAEVRNHQLGFVFQSHHLLPQCTVLENVLVPTLADRTRRQRAEDEERARTLLGRV